MRLLTLNTHSLIDGSEDHSINQLTEAILKYNFDVIALQEVNQPKKNNKSGAGVPICTNYPLKNGNFMQILLKNVNKPSQIYSGVWCGFKEGYGCYEEGIGIMTRYPILGVKTVMISSGQEKEMWKRRYALGIKTERVLLPICQSPHKLRCITCKCTKF